MSLYPEKMVVDVPEIGDMKSKEIVEVLIKGVDMSKVHENEEVKGINPLSKGVEVVTSLGKYKADNVIIATGLGNYKPRPLGVLGEERCRNVLYSLLDPSLMKDKDVAVFGGGDSALDWAAQLSDVAKRVHLVHRRTEFRGNADTIKGKDVILHLPYVPLAIYAEEGLAKKITIKKVDDGSTLDLDVDFVLVNYGSAPEPATFGFKMASGGFGLEVEDDFKVAEHVYACGDCVYSTEYKKRMVPGFREADIILSKLVL